MKQKPKAETIFPWLRANLGKKCLAPLTGTDSRALQAAVQIIEHYAYDSDPTVLAAFRLVVLRMQPKCYVFAFHAIAHVMDWSDRERIWLSSHLPSEIRHFQRCAYEPGSRALVSQDAN